MDENFQVDVAFSIISFLQIYVEFIQVFNFGICSGNTYRLLCLPVNCLTNVHIKQTTLRTQISFMCQLPCSLQTFRPAMHDCSLCKLYDALIF